MRSEIQVFDSARIALTKGINLIEASAGTGKTYAIAMLALRCIAELGIPIDKLLIVTFTKAATEELKTRIRARLVEARDLLQGKPAKKDRDQTLADWAETAENRALMLARLQLALTDIDMAGIFTIHAFCQRMLQEQALESGQLFDVELLTDIESIRAQVVDDFWRTHVYTLAPLPCLVLIGSFPTPESLWKSVTGGNATRVEPETGSISEALALLDAAFSRMASWWQQRSVDLYPHYLQGVAEQKFKSGFRTDFEAWWQGLAGFFSGENNRLPANLDLLTQARLMDKLNGNQLRGDRKKLDFLAGWPLPEGEITDLLQAIAALLLSFRAGLARALTEEVEQRLLREGTMSFNDLIVRLSRALKDEHGGGALRRILNERYRAALIDEFQDTDAAQWHIFATLFGGGTHYLYLIGDPKQAIYRFRGADIFSYFIAKQSADAHLTLERNYRSHPHLVAEVNRLFASRPQPFGFPESVMDYHRVVPARTIEDGSLQRDGKAAAAMVYCRLPQSEQKDGRWTSGRAAEQILHFVLHEVARLLDPDNAMLLTDKNGTRPVRPKDIAILVRSNRQAEQYLQILAGGSIPAVVASRQSVFATETCREMFSLLDAIGAPGDLLRLKTAMTIPWFGLSGLALQTIWQDDARFDDWHNRFQVYFQLWREQGFLTMMNRLLGDERVLVTLAAGTTAERHIANIHHLLELIQAAETTDKLGIGQTLQWLRTMMNGRRGEEDIELRLESDEEAVRIVTMHSAKGLEYPIVFCPFLWHRSNRLQQEKMVITCHDPDYGLVLDLGSDQFEERKKRALAEELAEELRLLYVAVTRAKLRCYIFWADVKPTAKVADSFSSALGYLLFPERDIDSHGRQAALQSLSELQSAEYRVITDCRNDKISSGREALPTENFAPLQPSGRSLHTDWQMSSYSALAALSDQNELDSHPPLLPHGEAVAISCPDLPSGANFGNVIHDILEKVPFASIAAGEDISERIARQCIRYGVRAEADVLRNLLQIIVTTPLSPALDRDFSLAGLTEERCVREMPFYFHPDRIATKEINFILAAEPTFTPLAQKVMQGYLTGFVDLLCEYQGRFYILDYKTNNLGGSACDYSPGNLVRAMAAHNYGLQYWIYTVVLNRHLRNVLPGYSYKCHFGGVMYLFVRGMIPAKPGSGVYHTLPDESVLDRLSACMGDRR